MRVFCILAAAAAFLHLSCPLCPGQTGKVSIKQAWPPGAYTMTQTAKDQSEQSVGGQTDKSSTTSTTVWQLNVGRPNEKGDKQIAATVLKYRFDEQGDTPSSYDSDAPAANQDKDNVFVFGALIGAPVSVTLDADDAVVEVSGLDRLWVDLTPKANTDGRKGRLAQASLEFADKAIEQSLRRIEAIVPKKDVAAGDKWSSGVRTDFPIIGEVKQRFDCTFKGVENAQGGRLAVIELEGRYESTKPKPGQVQGQEVTVSSLAVQEKADVKIDLASGIAVSDRKTMTVSATIQANDENGRPVQLVVKSTNEVTTTIVPAGSAAPSLQPAGAQQPQTEMRAGAQPAPGQTGQSAQPSRALQPAQPMQGTQAAAPVTYVTYRCIDQGGIRDQATGEWLEAFHLLIPKGWTFQGGLRWVANEKRPDQLSKTDLLMPVKSDYAVSSPDGRCVFRSYPAEYWVDTSRTAQTAAGAGFQIGANYNGMIVYPVLTPQQYISRFVYPRQHGAVAGSSSADDRPLPKLAELYAQESARMNQLLSSTGTQGNLSFQAGTVTIDYTANQVPYRETFVAIMQYIDTAGMVMFWPRSNFSYRAPRDEFERWRPVFVTMATSVQGNPRWSLHLSQITQKSAISQQQMDDYVHRVQREIADSHAATNHELARDMGYLTSPYYAYKGTDGNRYTLPTDKYHFMNAKGELLSQDRFDPPSSEWTSIEPYNQ